GKLLRLKTIVLWPRDENYFRRGWAGKKRDGRGNWILDSVANNATAHYLHNMLYVLGEEEDRSACPGSVTAELYRANKIENYDTAAIRVYTKNEAEILFIASHAVDEQIAPKFIFEFEKARVEYESEDGSGEIKALFNDGTVKNYGSPNEEHIIKLRTVLDCLNGRG
ncbi:MAG TPA: gfo/Idh/MocA family oxidoreductase, partial [Clostridiaceae bacterium]|nr:gfo/Idh/MocA family oxidoreductase [Clostridiaceae bacterium]